MRGEEGQRGIEEPHTHALEPRRMPHAGLHPVECAQNVEAADREVARLQEGPGCVDLTNSSLYASRHESTGE